MRATILQGDCRTVLAGLPAESVQCVVTSPPYFGLRAYGTNPQVWGGDPECDHQWETERYYREGGNSGSSKDAFHEAGPENAARLKETRWRETTTCGKCGAWRGELGAEPTPALFVDHIVEVFREVRRVLRPDGVVWLNLGDTYARNPAKGQHKPGDSGKQAYLYDHGGGRASATADLGRSGLKEKDLMGIPWRVAFALQDDGWWLRRDVIWDKPNALPESVTDRPSGSHEYVFLLTRSANYYYDADAIREPHSDVSLARVRRGHHDPGHKYEDGPGDQTIANDLSHACHPNGRNKRSVWRVNTANYKGSHYATFPPDLIAPMILAGTSERGCCPNCRAPWERITQKGEPDREWQRRCGGNADGEYHGQGTKDYERAGVQNPSSVKARILAGMRDRKTVGWRPTCECPRHEPVPCTCLDPFGGSGTVGEVATKLGRQAVLVELNPDYVQQASERNAQLGLSL
jgi:DNA modification methylase